MATLDPRPEYQGPQLPPVAQAISLSMEQMFEREQLWRSIDTLTGITELRELAKQMLDHWSELKAASDWIMGSTPHVQLSPRQDLTRFSIARELDAVSDLKTLKKAAKELVEVVFQRRAANNWLMRGARGCSFDADREAQKMRSVGES